MGTHTMMPMPGHFLVERNLASLSLVTLFVILVYCLVSYLSSPLRHYPGPFLAKFTNLWRLYYITKGSFQHDLSRLHKKYGPVVRIAPNVLDVDDPSLLKVVFGTKGDWKKTGYYNSASSFINGHIVYNVFSQKDEEKHAAEKKPIAKYYSPTGVVTLEPLIDKTITQLCDELDKRFAAKTASNAKKPFDLGNWILYYAWDANGTVTFSQPFGYLSAGCDFDGTLHASESILDYFSWVGCIPLVDRLIEKNSIAAFLRGPSGFSALGATCVGRLIARYQGTDSRENPTQPDYVDRFIEAKKDDARIDDNQIVSWIMINMGAGADTTAIVIRSALYYSLKTKGVWERLRKELDESGIEKGTPVGLKEARRVPYLEAVVREAIRYLPGVSLGLERYVPAGGQRLAFKGGERSVPEGSVLAFNPWIINRNQGVWGDDSYDFKPERWLRGKGESEEGFARRLRAMNDTDLSFGAGSRLCIGKNLGLMHAYKVVATLALNYDIQLAHPEREWTVINSWFPRQEGLEVRMTRRAG